MNAPWISEAEKFGSRAEEKSVIEICETCGFPFNVSSSEACSDGNDNKFCCHDCFDEFYGYRRVV